MTDTNYGITLKRGATVLGEITNLGLPEKLTEAIEKTNHSSGGVREFIPSKLSEIAEFTVTLNATETLLELIDGDIDAGTVSTFTVVYPTGLSMNPWIFSGFPVSMALQDADAQSPDVLQVDVTIRPTGALTISGAA